ncbi:MAG: ImmA/IrrE family metallo-endopeptidase [Desulfobulbaceae bacterium]|nr:ImmA/IrrE family metallo-endopeptidase [Desulfobulbaceae bacterium]
MGRISGPLISEASRTGQNPEAFLNETEGYNNPHSITVTSNLSNMMRKSQRYSHSQIETLATNLLKELWLKRQQMWGWSPSDPTVVIEPAKGLELLGFSLNYEQDLGSYYSDKGDVKTAGVINSETKSVHISKQLPENTRLFTAAHELGHALLHDTSSSFHRDRPLNGESMSREQIEVEADKFATFFLMPAKLVKSRFIEIFGTEQFSLTEGSAFALSCSSLMEVKKRYKTLRHISRLLAGTKSYGGRNLYSLADQFRVSIEAMAIRLEELDLIVKPAFRS